MLTWCWLAMKRYCRWNYFYNGFPFRGSRRNLNFVLRMQFPQKFCPFCDKKVIASALWQLRINFTCIFKVFLKNLPSGPCDYICILIVYLKFTLAYMPTPPDVIGVTIVSWFIVWQAPKVGSMRRIMCSDWLPERARWSDTARSGLPVLLPQ